MCVGGAQVCILSKSPECSLLFLHSCSDWMPKWLAVLLAGGLVVSWAGTLFGGPFGEKLLVVFWKADSSNHVLSN